MHLKEYLTKERLSQKKFASLVGVSGVQINHLVHGNRLPSLKLLKKIEKITSGLVSTDDFLTEEAKNEIAKL